MNFQFKTKNIFQGNLISNYAGSFFSAVAPIIAIPFYVKSFGADRYGLIGFVILLQAIIGMFEAGISQALIKEFINSRLSRNTKIISRILSAFEIIYLFLSLCLLLLIYFLAELLVSEWLRVPIQIQEEAVSIVQISAIFLSISIFGSLYRSALLSLESHFVFNAITSASIVLRHSTGIVIAVQCNSPLLLIIWFTISAVFEIGIKRWYARKTYVHIKSDLISILMEAGPIVRVSGKMVLGTLIGAFAVQADKIFASNMLPIDQFSYFTLASMLSMGFLQFIYPINTASLPLIIDAHKKGASLISSNFRILKLFFTIFIIAWIVFLIIGERLMFIWLRDESLAHIIHPIFIFLFIGTTLNALYGIGLNNLLASGRIGSIAVVNGIAFVCTIIALPIFIAQFGLVGSASGWIVFNSVALLSILYIYSRPRVNRS